MRKIGVMGGTFNPIHMGHLKLSQWVLDALELEEIWFIPAGMPYKKKEDAVLPGEERLHMTRLAIEENDRFRCLDMEIRRQGYTYTYETMLELKERYPNTSFYFIVGADCLFSIENWKEPEKIMENCILTVAVRGGATFAEMDEKRRELQERFGGEIILLSYPGMELSSSEIRRRVTEGKSIQYMVPEAVRDYIQKKGFYGGQDHGFERD